MGEKKKYRMTYGAGQSIQVAKDTCWLPTEVYLEEIPTELPSEPPKERTLVEKIDQDDAWHGSIYEAKVIANLALTEALSVVDEWERLTTSDLRKMFRDRFLGKD